MRSSKPTDLEWPEPQFTEQEAVAFAEERRWEPLTLRERAELQLCQRRVCMPLSVFHAALEVALGRSVQHLEIAENRGGLWKELSGDAPPPSLADILSLAPEGKPIILGAPQAG